MKRILFYLLTIIPLLAEVSAARAAELVMFEAPGCAWCEAWMEEIGPIYPKTDEAAKAPLRIVDLTDKPLPADIKTTEPVRMTPTFVLVDDAGQELGRITGYAGDEMFWWQLGTLMESLEE